MVVKRTELIPHTGKVIFLQATPDALEQNVKEGEEKSLSCKHLNGESAIEI